MVLDHGSWRTLWSSLCGDAHISATQNVALDTFGGMRGGTHEVLVPFDDYLVVFEL